MAQEAGASIIAPSQLPIRTEKALSKLCGCNVSFHVCFPEHILHHLQDMRSA